MAGCIKRNAKSPSQVIDIKHDTFTFTGQWWTVFGNPTRHGVWLIWGNSGNGKTSFALMLCKYLCTLLKRGEKMLYNSLEEGYSNSMQNSLKIAGMLDVNGIFTMIDGENLEDFTQRLRRPKSPKVVVIDSFQYFFRNKDEYFAFTEEFARKKLIIIVSHADGRLPEGRAARKAMYDVTQKVYIEGFRALNKGRSFGDKELPWMDIWTEKAVKYWEGRDIKNVDKKSCKTKKTDNHEENQQQTDNPTTD